MTSALLALLLFSSISTAITTSNDDTKSLIRIETTDGNINLPMDAEIVSRQSKTTIDVLLKSSLLSQISAPYTILESDFDQAAIATAQDYHTLEETEDFLQDTAETYSDITTLTSLGTTYEGREILCLEISDNPGLEEDEPGILFIGLHHAREWPGLEICLTIIEDLTASYEADSEIKDLVDNNRIWIVPCVNPDGYYYCHDQGRDWRKNRHYFPETGTYGVDLNRNYGGSSNGDPVGMWGSLASDSVTHYPSSSIYCGPSPGSEVEVAAIKNLIINNPIHCGITYHTYGELVMWPWGYADQRAPHDSLLSLVGQNIASLIGRQSGTGTYTPTQASGLYPTTGDTCDWAYGYGNYVLARPLFFYTIEACSSFHPDSSYLEVITSENLEGALYLIDQAHTVKSLTPRVLPPRLTETHNTSSITLEWNDDEHADYYQLDQLTNPTTHIDTAEEDNTLWHLHGFSRSTINPCQGDYSYKAQNVNELVHSMTTNQPTYIEPGASLTFSIWYDIEEEWDYGFLEVSTNARTYDILDTYNGNSNGWQQLSYSLDSYAGESITIRFRYTTDTATTGQGVFIDDIGPIVSYERETIDSSLTETNYQLDGLAPDTYYYQLRGYNSQHGWCDYSTILKIQTDSTNQGPQTPTAPDGPTQNLANVDLTYTTSTTDPEDDQILYQFDWDDGSMSTWIGPFESGSVASSTHQWQNPGTYNLRCRALDTNGQISGWSEQTTVIIQYQQPTLKIQNISGGLLRLQAELTNTAEQSVEDIFVSIVTEGLCLTTNFEDIISSLDPDESIVLTSYPIIGFGPLTITVTAATELQHVEETIQANIFLMFLKIQS